MKRIFSLTFAFLLLYCFVPSVIASEIVEESRPIHKKHKNVGGKLNPHSIDMEKLSTFKPFNLDFGIIDFSQWKTIIVHHKTKSPGK